MVKIKTKKQLNLPQLIEWAQDNIEEATKKVYRVNENEVLGEHVRFTEVYSDLEVRLHGYIPFDTTFTVDVVEELTEDTKLNLIERFIGGTGIVYYTSNGNTTIKECLKRSPSDCTTTHFYIENDDRELVLIWQDGKLI